MKTKVHVASIMNGALDGTVDNLIATLARIDNEDPRHLTFEIDTVTVNNYSVGVLRVYAEED